MHTVDGSIHPAQPFDFSKTLRFVRDFRPCADEQCVDDRGMSKAVIVAGRPIVFSVHAATPISLHYTVAAEAPVDPCLHLLAQDRIRFHLGTDDDLNEFYAIAQEDVHFAPIARALHGLHHVKFVTPFEIAAWAILGHYVPIHVARMMKRRFVERFGTAVEHEGRTYQAFPSARTVSHLGVAEIAAAIKNARKAEAIIAVAEAFNAIDEPFLRFGRYDEVYRWLRAIKGIGEWSAMFIMVRGLGRMDRIDAFGPLLDAASQAYQKNVGKKELLTLAERYGKWQGYWAFYLRQQRTAAELSLAS